MGKILIGTSSWADHSLVESGRFYPPEIKTAAERLRYYANEFPIAEIDSTYHFFPTNQNLELWLGNTPSGFTFDVRVFSMFTGHPTQFRSLPRSVREENPVLAEHKGPLYLHHLSKETVDKLWNIFAGQVEQIEKAGKLGVILFQFPPWFHPSKENYAYIESCCERFPNKEVAVEFRTPGWLTGDTLKETLAFLRSHEMALVCVDEPQGMKTSVPPVAEITEKTGIVRFHGRNAEAWEKKDIMAEERFHYLYSRKELQNWLPDLRRMAETAEKVHVIFKNKSEDFPVQNARMLKELLG